MTRKQFTFYESFYRAIRRIRQKSARADIYDAICAYALEGKEPDWDKLGDAAIVALELVLPVLNTAKRRADGACITTQKREAPTTPPPRSFHAPTTLPPHEGEKELEKEGEGEKELEKDVETETEAEVEAPGVSVSAERNFSLFWEAYPRKAGREKARKVFFETNVELDTLLDALREQKASSQWCVSGGRYIPYPATWLKERRWEDQLAPSSQIPKGASGKLGEEELAAIRRVMAEG